MHTQINIKDYFIEHKVLRKIIHKVIWFKSCNNCYGLCLGAPSPPKPLVVTDGGFRKEARARVSDIAQQTKSLLNKAQRPGSNLSTTIHTGPTRRRATCLYSLHWGSWKQKITMRTSCIVRPCIKHIKGKKNQNKTVAGSSVWCWEQGCVVTKLFHWL